MLRNAAARRDQASVASLIMVAGVDARRSRRVATSRMGVDDDAWRMVANATVRLQWQ